MSFSDVFCFEKLSNFLCGLLTDTKDWCIAVLARYLNISLTLWHMTVWMSRLAFSKCFTRYAYTYTLFYANLTNNNNKTEKASKQIIPSTNVC